MHRLILFALVACLGLSASYAQDTAKKRPAAKTPPGYGYKHQYYGRYKPRADSARRKFAHIMRVNTDSVLPALSHQNLNAQYQFLIGHVYNYQQPLISALWKNASDTLKANRAKLNEAVGKIATQNKAADSLKTQLASQSDELARQGGMDVFGLVLAKATYNIIVWGLVVLFAIVAVVVIGRSGAYRREARHRTQLYSELEEEYKTFKSKANEKEKKLARELQTERNKLDELLGRG